MTSIVSWEITLVYIGTMAWSVGQADAELHGAAAYTRRPPRATGTVPDQTTMVRSSRRAEGGITRSSSSSVVRPSQSLAIASVAIE
jgi:hypothetical protein